MSLPIIIPLPLYSRRIFFFSARGARSVNISSIIGAISIVSLHSTVRSSLISSRVFVICDILSFCSCSSARNSAVSLLIFGCSTEKSSICAWVKASGVLNSCAAFPVNCRWAVKPLSSRSSILLNEWQNCLNSGKTSSLNFISAKLLGCTFSTWEAKLFSDFKARPLTKYASIPPSTLTATVMYQLVVLNEACAPLTIMVSSRSRFSFSGLNELGFPLSILLYADIPLPIESIYRLPEKPIKQFISTQVMQIKTVVIKVIRHCKESFFIFSPPLHNPRLYGCE